MSCKFPHHYYDQQIYLNMSNGLTGRLGPRGFAGAEGPTGPTVPAGTTGATGPTGPTGPIGPTGPQGATGASGSLDAWSRLGNAGTNSSTNFIVTTDNQALTIRINNTNAIRVTAKGQIETLGGSTTDTSTFIGVGAGSMATSSILRCVLIGNRAVNLLGQFGGFDCTVVGIDALRLMTTNNSCFAYGNYCLENCTQTGNCGYGLRCIDVLDVLCGI